MRWIFLFLSLSCLRASSSCALCGNKSEDLHHNVTLGRMALYFDNDADSDKEGTPSPTHVDEGELVKVLNNYGSPIELSPRSIVGQRSPPPAPATKTVVVEKVIKVNRPCKKEQCLQQRLESLRKVDPKFTDYMEKRFYLVGKMRQRNHELHAQLENLLHATAVLKANGQEIKGKGSSEDVAAGLESMISNRRMARILKHKRLCKCLLAHYMHDVDQLMRQMHAKSQHCESSIETWLRMNKEQKERLYKILLHAQRRDMQRLIQLRDLKLWYAKKLHIIDQVSKRRLQRMVAVLQQQESNFQTRLWKRLQELQRSDNGWARHERAYKEALLIMSRQHTMLLRESYRQGRKLEYLTNLIRKKVLPQQEALALASVQTMGKLGSIHKQCARLCKRKNQMSRHTQITQQKSRQTQAARSRASTVAQYKPAREQPRARLVAQHLSCQLGKCRVARRLRQLKKELLKTLDEGCSDVHSKSDKNLIHSQTYNTPRLSANVGSYDMTNLQETLMQPLTEAETVSNPIFTESAALKSSVTFHKFAERGDRRIVGKTIRKGIVQHSVHPCAQHNADFVQ